MVWRFWTGDGGAESSDRAWAQRQAGEAQNHIFDRFVQSLFFVLTVVQVLR